jgi:ATP-dependent DNA helicase RecQ
MPTGGGKSVCFQIPALLGSGLTVVISPLIALMHDQVQGLLANGIKAAYLNSTLSLAQQYQIEQDCANDNLKLLYVSPEKLLAQGFFDFLKRLNISLFAVDESHCISFWGHDFRPEYTKLNTIKEHFASVPIIALTATADKVTRRDILNQLGTPDAKVFISSFDRPNLSLSVAPGRKKINQIQDFLIKRRNQSGIIYCLARKTTETVAESLRAMGFKAKHYHAGEPSEYRSRVQDEFIRDDIQIIVATIAFGMGIDKSNVRWVIHHNLPKNVESFYQEIGRAGRDGLPSDTLLFYSYADVMTQLDFIEKSEAPLVQKELIRAKLERIKQYAEADICRRRILISYFNETVDKDCGNCDVCKNPKQKFDGTLLAQKALSAIARTEQQVATGMLIDILRGSQNQNVIRKGYDKLKTFGVGREIRADEWADYIYQMLNRGIIDIAYDENHIFKLNETSWKVLKEGMKVPLSRFESMLERKTREEAQQADLPLSKTRKEVIKDALFERLRTLRKTLADERSIPPYLIFSDQTLSDMAQNKPISRLEMMAVAGVGQQKFQLYGQYFIDEVLQFVQDVPASQKIKAKADGSTFRMTHVLYDDGFDIQEIAEQRQLSLGTIVGHLIRLRNEGQKIDLERFINNKDYQDIIKKARALGIAKDGPIKELMEFFGERFQAHQFRLALAIWEGQ